MKKINVFILVIVVLCFGCRTSNNTTQQEAIIQEKYDNLFDTRNNHFIISSSDDIYKDKTLQVDLDLDGEKETIIIGKDYPNGVKIRGIKGKYTTNFLFDDADDVRINEILDGMFDEDGELNNGCYIQASYVDLDNDGKYEVLISVRDKRIQMITAIYRVRDAEEASFKLIGIIEGQSNMYLIGNHIIAPYGSFGLCEEYIYDGQRIYKAM